MPCFDLALPYQELNCHVELLIIFFFQKNVHLFIFDCAGSSLLCRPLITVASLVVEHRP